MRAADPLPGPPPAAASPTTASVDRPSDGGDPRAAGRRDAPAAGETRPLVAFAHAGADWIRGSERCLLDLVTGLDPARFRALVLCDAPALQQELTRRGVDVVPVPRWKQSPVNSARVRRWLVPLLRERGVALVHANMVQTLPALVPAAYRLRLPLVAHLHMPLTAVGERHQALVRRAAVAVGVADHVVAPLRRDRAGAPDAPSERVRVIFNAVDGARLAAGSAASLRASLGIADDAFVVASVASLIPGKRHDVTLRALAAELGVQGAAHFLGARPDVGAVLRDATSVLVSSSPEEALGLSLLEAQWVGVPVVAADNPGHREALGTAGVLVPPGDPGALADALTALAADPGRRAALVAAGQAATHARCSLGRYVGAFEALYAELLARPRTAYGGPPGLYWPRAAAAWLAAGVRIRLARRRGRAAAAAPVGPRPGRG